MSDQNWPPAGQGSNPDPSAEQPQAPTPPASDPYQAPVAGETPAVDPYQAPATGYTPPAADPYQAPATGYTPPAADPYQAPATGYTPPYQAPAAGYTPPPADPYQPTAGYTPPAGGYQGGYSEPQNPYGGPGAVPPPYGAAGGPGGGPSFGGVPLAAWGKRALGALVDYLPTVIIQWVFSGIGSVIASATESYGIASLFGFVGWAIGLAWLIWNTGYKAGTTGVSLGRSIAKTKLVSEATGQPIGFGMAVVRYIAHIVDAIICYIGFLFPLWDAKRQTIADKLVKTLVLDVSADPGAATFEWK